MKTISRKHILQYFILALCAGIIIKYFADRKDELGQIFNLHGRDLILLTLLGFLIHMIMGYKMFFILRKLGLRGMSYLPWLKVFTISRFLNFHFIQGGNVYRGVKLKRDYSFSYTDSLSMMAIFAWFDAVFILFVSLVMVMGLDRKLSLLGINAVILLTFLLFLLTSGPFVYRSIFKKIQAKSPQIVWLHGKLAHLTDCLTDNIRDKHTLISLFLLSLTTFLLFAWQIYVAFSAIGAKIDLAEVTVFTAITLLSGIINITPSNIGIIEVTYGYLSKALGKTMGSGIIVCGILRIVGYIIVLLFVIFNQLASLRPNNRKNIQNPA